VEKVGLKALLPVSGPATGVCNCHDLDDAGGTFPVNQSKGKLSEQEPSGQVRAGCPALRRVNDLGERAFHFSIELEGRVWAALKVPIEGCVVFGGGFVMQIDGGTTHGS